VLLTDLLGAERVAVIGGPAHAREMVTEGAALVAAAVDERLALMIANVFTRARPSSRWGSGCWPAI
jgi:glycerol-3-phosphate dehydrogenase (NAD(P)+)